VKLDDLNSRLAHLLGLPPEKTEEMLRAAKVEVSTDGTYSVSIGTAKFVGKLPEKLAWLPDEIRDASAGDWPSPLMKPR